MKKCLYFIVFVVILLASSGCVTDGIFGKSSKKEAKQADKIQKVEDKQNINLQDKMDQVGVLASGTDYALNKVTNKEPPVEVAQDINKRVLSLSGNPNIEAQKEMWKMVDSLLIDKQKGLELLAKKDIEISDLQQKDKQLRNEWQKEIDKYQILAANTSMKADTLQQSMDKMNAWGGIGAIWYGIKRLIVRLAWILSIGGVLFIILRFASVSNPIAGAIFGVFEHIISWLINIISVIFPKALSIAGNVSKEIYNKSALLLKKIIDGIQNIKDIEKRTGKDITLKELLVELDKSMDTNEKEMVLQIKGELGY